ncbi:MAG: NAD-dependent epimerase/dehydratase family protein [Bacteroidota bacterium]
MQVIFGAGGPIGRQLSKELKKYTDSVRLVSRKAKKTLPECIAFQADLAKKNDAIEAAKGCEIVYLTAGLEYKTKVWKELWPLIMSNTIEACKLNDAALVFFDNIYMYDKNHINGMNENTPVNPSSEKGKVRALIGKMMMDEVSKGNLKGIIVRSADFISPNNSLLTEMIFNNLKKIRTQCGLWI